MSASIFQTSDNVSPFLLTEAVVPGLPEHLRVVPDQLTEWLVWKHRTSAYREDVRRRCTGDTPAAARERATELALCADDPAYFLIMYGVVFEPRKQGDRKPGWYRWMLYASQVQTIRAIQYSMSTEELGRGDLVIEKSREMGISWLVCGWVAHQFLFADNFVAGLISRVADKVDKAGDPDTLFYKIRANLGLLDQVPPHLRLPVWMRPKGFTLEDHSSLRQITHPTKSNVIVGETTTETAGVGGRATVRINDEAARFDDFDQAWANQGGTSNHRIAISSADLKSPGFKVLADLGRECVRNPQREGPTFLRLDWWYSPYHTDEWYRNEKARFKTDPHFFAREYEIDYYAGAGQIVYPRFAQMRPVDAPYDPYLGRLWCAIDPGNADPTAIVWIQEDKVRNRYRVVNSFEGRGGEDPRFFASILTGVRVSGYNGFDYESYPGLDALMEWTASLNRPVIYCGDHFGTHKGGDGARTFYEALREESAQLTGRAHIISVQTITKMAGGGDARSFANRRIALNKVGPRMDFDQSYGGVAVLTALQESRFMDRKDNRGYQSELLEPQHDKFSHRRSAVEFWAVLMTNEEAMATHVTGMESTAPMRISMSGKRIA